MLLSLIVAMDDNRVIGREGRLPWHLPADLQYFKQVTIGKPVLMGRKTHESIGKPLPGRTNVVITRNPRYDAVGCVVVTSLDDAITSVANYPEVMVIGGAGLYRQVLPRAQRIYLTEVHATLKGDAYFPELDEDAWHEVSRDGHPADERNPYPYSFVILERGS